MNFPKIRGRVKDRNMEKEKRENANIAYIDGANLYKEEIIKEKAPNADSRIRVFFVVIL